jgi:cytidylate kinase
MNNNYSINIGRQFGSGGHEIGQKLATLLGISFYDKELIRLASQKSGVKEEFFEKADEKEPYRLFTGLMGLQNYLTDEPFSGYYLSNETLFKIQSDVIRSLAEQKSCVFVGRCADYILQEKPRCLNIFISADIYDRIKRIAKINNVSEENAESLIKKTDRKRSRYYKFFSGKVWGAAGSYHLCINSSVLGVDETVNLIRDFASKRFGLR